MWQVLPTRGDIRKSIWIAFFTETLDKLIVPISLKKKHNLWHNIWSPKILRLKWLFVDNHQHEYSRNRSIRLWNFVWLNKYYWYPFRANVFICCGGNPCDNIMLYRTHNVEQALRLQVDCRMLFHQADECIASQQAICRGIAKQRDCQSKSEPSRLSDGKHDMLVRNPCHSRVFLRD